MSTPIRIAVIGGGPAGMCAAGAAIRNGADVTLFDHSERLGKKLAITGKGRCNVTNNCSVPEFLENVPRNPRFLYGALNSFSPSDTMSLFRSLGVELKTERGRRVFPASDHATDIVGAMKKYCKDASIITKHVSRINVCKDGRFTVNSDTQHIYDRIIIAGGGRSYPLTGSDGSCYKIASDLGHTITPIVPSLVPIESSDAICRELMGLSLKNVSIKVLDSNGACLYSDFGEMLFTHFGVSGPMILSASSHLHGISVAALTLSIDLKPALDDKTLDHRLLSDFSEKSNRDFQNAMSGLLPQKLIQPFVIRSGIPPHKKVNVITKEERAAVRSLLKDFRIRLSALRPIDEAIVTSGGVSIKEISPKTMESKLVRGLYFAGEILDVDAYTGGYNLQIAFSTGHLAGISASADA